MSELLGWTAEAVAAVEGLYVKARAQVRSRVFENGKLSAALINREQHAAHGLAWLATYCTALESLSAYCGDLARENRLGELESLLIQAAFGEYLNHIAGGIPMNQAEFARPSSMGLSENDLAPLRRNGSGRLMRDGMSETVRTRIAAFLRPRRGASTFGDCGLDETLDRMREEMRRFADSRDRKSTRLNSSHSQISYAVFCLKKKDQLAGPGRVVEGVHPEGQPAGRQGLDARSLGGLVVQDQGLMARVVEVRAVLA